MKVKAAREHGSELNGLRSHPASSMSLVSTKPEPVESRLGAILVGSSAVIELKEAKVL
jgi:hypothetical protein